MLQRAIGCFSFGLSIKAAIDIVVVVICFWHMRLGGFMPQHTLVVPHGMGMPALPRIRAIACIMVFGAASAFADEGGTVPPDGSDVISLFKAACHKDYESDETRRLAIELSGHAQAGDREFFNGLESELRRMRQDPLIESADREYRIARTLIERTFINLELWSPTVLEFAEESLDDPNARLAFQRSILFNVPTRLAAEQPSTPAGAKRHDYPKERVVAFLVKAANRPETEIREAAFYGLVDLAKSDFEYGWDRQAAIPILRKYANERGVPFEERATYLGWLIRMDAPGSDQYVESYRQFVLNPANPIGFRHKFGQTLQKLGHLSVAEFNTIRDENLSVRGSEISTNGVSSIAIDGNDKSDSSNSEGVD